MSFLNLCTGNTGNHSKQSPSQAAVNGAGLRDDRVLGEVWVTGSRQFTGNRTDLLWERESSTSAQHLPAVSASLTANVLCISSCC